MTTLTRETNAATDPPLNADAGPVSSPLTAASARLHYFAHRACRILTWIVVAVAVLTVANWVSELILPQPAQALPGIPDITEICNPNYQLPEPGNPTVNMQGNYATAGDQGLWVTPESGSYSGTSAMGSAYGTGGFTWYTYGTSLCQPLDYTVNITTLLAGTLLSWLVAAASLMGFVMQAAFSTNIVNAILLQPDLSNTITSINDSLWEGWYPLILGAAVVTVGLLILTTRVQEAAGRFLWVVVATALVAGIAISPSGLSNIGVRINDATNTASSSALMAIAGPSEACETLSGADGTSTEDGVTCMATTMANDFVMPTWAVGAAGTRAEESAPIVADDEGNTSGASPDTWARWNTEGDSVGEDVTYAATQLPPEGVVPTSRASGVPTTAEYLRWTQTYTAAEAKALEENPEMRCSQTSSPNLEDLGRMASQDDAQTSDDLCVKKWAVRASILYGLKASDPSAYAAATGKDDLNSRISPAVMSMPISGAAQVSLMFVGILMFFYQLEFLIYWFSILLFLMASMVKGPGVMKNWAGWVGATMLKRVGLGLMLGFALLIFQWVQRGLINVAIDGWGALMLVFTSLITQTIFLCGMVALLVMWMKLRKVLLRETKLERFGTSKPVEAMQGAGKRLLSAGVGAAGGGLTGGPGGAAIGAGTAVLSPKANLTSSMRKGINSGSAITQGRLSSGEARTTLTSSRQEAAVQESHSRNSLQSAQSHEEIAATATRESVQLGDESQQTRHSAQQYDETVNAEVQEYVTQYLPEGRTASTELATANVQASTAERDVTSAVEHRAEFSHKHDLSHMHQLDSNGNLVITDLTTGAVTTTPDTNLYRPDLAPDQVFTTEEMVNEYNSIKLEEIEAQESLASAEITREAAESDISRLVAQNRKQIAGMTNQQITDKFKDDPELAHQAKAWKTSQARAQRLHRQAEELNKRSLARKADAERANRDATRDRGEARDSSHRAAQQNLMGDKAEKTLESKSGAKAAANQLLHGMGGSSRRR